MRLRSVSTVARTTTRRAGRALPPEVFELLGRELGIGAGPARLRPCRRHRQVHSRTDRPRSRRRRGRAGRRHATTVRRGPPGRRAARRNRRGDPVGRRIRRRGHRGPGIPLVRSAGRARRRSVECCVQPVAWPWCGTAGTNRFPGSPRCPPCWVGTSSRTAGTTGPDWAAAVETAGGFTPSCRPRCPTCRK